MIIQKKNIFEKEKYMNCSVASKMEEKTEYQSQAGNFDSNYNEMLMINDNKPKKRVYRRRKNRQMKIAN